MLNLTDHELNIDNIFLYAEDTFETKYQTLINKRRSIGIRYLNDAQNFIKYSCDMNYVYENTEWYNLNKKQNILIAFDAMNTDMLSNEKRNSIVSTLFTRGRKLNIFLVFYLISLFQKILD